MSQKIYFGSNLKMYKTVQQTEKYLKDLTICTEEIRKKYPQVQLFILPSYTALEKAAECTDQSVICICTKVHNFVSFSFQVLYYLILHVYCSMIITNSDFHDVIASSFLCHLFFDVFLYYNDARGKKG